MPHSSPRVWVVALSTSLAACFDVEQVAVGDPDETKPLPVDNFESGNGVPDNDSFLPWFCQQWQGTAVCGVAPGFKSDHGYSLTFQLLDTPNGKLDFPSAALRTWRSGDILDFARYENLVFSVRLEPGAQGLPDHTVTVRLSCPGGAAGDLIANISNSVPVGTDWEVHALKVAAFRQLKWDEPKVDKNACATHVSGLGFHLEPALADGQAANGTLTIDNVYLQ